MFYLNRIIFHGCAVIHTCRDVIFTVLTLSVLKTVSEGGIDIRILFKLAEKSVGFLTPKIIGPDRHGHVVGIAVADFRTKIGVLIAGGTVCGQGQFQILIHEQLCQLQCDDMSEAVPVWHLYRIALICIVVQQLLHVILHAGIEIFFKILCVADQVAHFRVVDQRIGAVVVINGIIIGQLKITDPRTDLAPGTETIDHQVGKSGGSRHGLPRRSLPEAPVAV